MTFGIAVDTPKNSIPKIGPAIPKIGSAIPKIFSDFQNCFSPHCLHPIMTCHIPN